MRYLGSELIAVGRIHQSTMHRRRQLIQPLPAGNPKPKSEARELRAVALPCPPTHGVLCGELLRGESERQQEVKASGAFPSHIVCGRVVRR